jgi:hypothetical protein
MTQYAHVNNGGESVFCVVGAVVISRVWSQFHQQSDNWEVSQLSFSMKLEEKWMQWISDTARGTQTG